MENTTRKNYGANGWTDSLEETGDAAGKEVFQGQSQSQTLPTERDVEHARYAATVQPERSLHERRSCKRSSRCAALQGFACRTRQRF